MSWNFSTPTVAKADFDAAVDAAPVGGQAEDVIADDVAAVKTLLKALGSRCKRDFLIASAGGHTLEEGQDDGWFDGFNLSVSGYSAANEPAKANTGLASE